MADNKIYPFAADADANILTDAEYASDGQRIIGNQPGVARAKLVNKALKQTTVMAYRLADFISYAGTNEVTDEITAAEFNTWLGFMIQLFNENRRGSYRGNHIIECVGTTLKIVDPNYLGYLLLAQNTQDASCHIQLPSLSDALMYDGATVTFTGNACAFDHPLVITTDPVDTATIIIRNINAGPDIQPALSSVLQLVAQPSESKWIGIYLDDYVDSPT